MLTQQLGELVDPEGMRLVEIDEPDDGRMVANPHAAGVSHPDLLHTRGLRQNRNKVPCIPGSETAGMVRRAPAGSGPAPGQPVAVPTPSGAWQQVVAVDPGQVFTPPGTMPTLSATRMPANYLTGRFAFTRRARTQAGETVLVHGAAGGIGAAALHLRHALRLLSTAVVSGPRKTETARTADADMVMRVDGRLDRVREHTGGRDVDVALDPVDGDRFADSPRALAPEGGERATRVISGGGLRRSSTLATFEYSPYSRDAPPRFYSEIKSHHPVVARPEFTRHRSPIELADGEALTFRASACPSQQGESCSSTKSSSVAVALGDTNLIPFLGR
ncbi:alcohol dehydrogenase catalytic domain-containing protein [Streptomyces canus]|uniref:alcohol dehydrogenase catalytic domain-containing protein n=1 Tax=Streptomyces canus TaxID=58343 RepID=UPI000AE88B0D|nr:hypothetical protein [Streptomyces canus]